MKISLNWLNDYIDLKSIPVDQIISTLNMSGLEVEDVINEREIYKDFISALVVEKVKHPNADKLSVCKVSDGKNILQVVCGAPNVQADQKIVFAPIGTIIPNGGYKISKAKLRGVESFGMICSENELLISNDHSGIMVLDNSVKEGTPISDVLGLNDVILDIAITPNRPDALSHIGVARDLSALFNLELKIPSIKLIESAKESSSAAEIIIEDKKNCPRYSSRIILNVDIKESPEWLKNRLTKIGLRPINNVVDVTNYVMYECGQPLHAFDLDRLEGKKIIVRSTDVESKFVTLDSKERDLPKNTLLICDAAKPIAIAGVMGGENSEINSATKNILIESAYFNPSSIRRTSRLLGLSTDASYRFERTTNFDQTVWASERAAQLISELGGGEILKHSIDIYPVNIQLNQVKLRFNQVKRILGFDIASNRINEIILKLGFKILNENSESLQLLVPAFRPDIEREIDVIEEIARINGYDNIPTETKISFSFKKNIDQTSFSDSIRNVCTSLGLFEMINNPLQSEKVAGITGQKIKVLNPQNLDMEFLRTSLLPGALTIVGKNNNLGEKDLALFEIGDVFNLGEGKNSINSFEDFTESQRLLILLSGRNSLKEWYSDEDFFDLYSLKGLVDSFLVKFSLDNVLNDVYYASGNEIFDLFIGKTIKNNQIGSGGRVRKNILKQFGIAQNVFAFEFDIEQLKHINADNKKYSEPLKYPKVVRDFAFILDDSITYEQLRKFIQSKSSELLKSVKLFDVFSNKSLGENKRSLAIQLEYYSIERTLTDEEVEKEWSQLINLIQKEFRAQLRGI
ncbi:MAG TPA: phenylalanine--tRNA ligase subunit beta [Ignavibacteriaceae bacterium]|nr:phenylalanine--tRNA ligase subunit beta [Ignavibacteriaceae bacterium]